MLGKDASSRNSAQTARHPAQRAGHRRELGFALLFLAIFAGLHFLYSAGRDTAVEHLLIDVCTVKPSAALIDFLSPSEQVTAMDHRLISPNAQLSILNGCEGIETMLLLSAAILAYAAPWRSKILAVPLGVGMIYLLNQLRIVALYYAYRHYQELFNLLHGVVAPLILIAGTGLFFLWWLSRLPIGPRPSGVLFGVI